MMGHQTLVVIGAVIFFVILAAHFGSRFADERDRYRLAAALAGLAVLAAALAVPWELAMFSRDGWPVRKLLAVAWVLVACSLGYRAWGLAGEARRRGVGRNGPGGRRFGGY